MSRSNHPRSPHHCPIIELSSDDLLETWHMAVEIYEEHKGKQDDKCAPGMNLSDENIPRKYWAPKLSERAVSIYTGLPMNPDPHARPDVGDCVEVRSSNNLDLGELYCAEGDVRTWPYVLALPIGFPETWQLMGWQYAGLVLDKAYKPKPSFHGYTWPVDELRPMEDLLPALYEKPHPE